MAALIPDERCLVLDGLIFFLQMKTEQSRLFPGPVQPTSSWLTPNALTYSTGTSLIFLQGEIKVSRHFKTWMIAKNFFRDAKNKNNNLIRKLAKVLLPPVGTEFPGHDLLHLPDRHEIGRFPDSFENPGQLRADQRLVLKKILPDQTDWTKTRSPEISRNKVKTRTMTLNLKNEIISSLLQKQ